MKNIKRFMPKAQQKITLCNPAFEEIIQQLDSEIEMIPDQPQAEIVYAHFFYGGCDWFVLSWDREEDIVFCYVILNGDSEMSELGDVLLSDLVDHGRIELDFYWDKKSLAQAKYDADPDYFPEPKNESNKATNHG